MTRGLRTLFIILLLSLPAEPLLGAELQTRFGPIVYQNAEQLQAYGRAIRPPLSLVYVAGELPASAIIERHEFLFEFIAEKLGIKLDGIRVQLKIVDSLAELKTAYVHLAPKSTKSVIGFYGHLEKDIWISRERLSLGLVMHEIAHAILDYYFIQTVPAGVDELIAESVEGMFR